MGDFVDTVVDTVPVWAPYIAVLYLAVLGLVLAALGYVCVTAGIEWVHDRRYAIVAPEQASVTPLTGQVPTRRCFRCGRLTTYPDDIEHGYCGNCHDWTPGQVNR